MNYSTKNGGRKNSVQSARQVKIGTPVEETENAFTEKPLQVAVYSKEQGTETPKAIVPKTIIPGGSGSELEYEVQEIAETAIVEVVADIAN